MDGWMTTSMYCLYVCIYVCIDVCMCVCMYVDTYTYIHMYAQTPAQTQVSVTGDWYKNAVRDPPFAGRYMSRFSLFTGNMYTSKT